MMRSSRRPRVLIFNDEANGAESDDPRYRWVLPGFYVGIALTPRLAALAFFAYFGICSDYSTAVDLFPYSFAVAIHIDESWCLAGFLGLATWPVYGAVGGWC